ncbi:eif2 kinase if2k-a (incomplete catalytic triad) [Cystoisospora suis]|uniref:non-specific serine/threonine protein kinase n=1 Tax=Cystoisospora suis TaxID=483139 RepID=A0A2C6L632_9APIC|nr:eif2 kinase if2k-a (incomplete catalytic triad) [Cystoisospora suis]
MEGGNMLSEQLRLVEGDGVMSGDRERQRQKMKGLLAKARRMGRNMEISYKGEVIGTPAYAAPEGGGLCDEKADIYSGALILLELLCPRFTTVMERVKTLEDFKLNYAAPEHIRLHMLPWYLLMKEMARPEPQHRPSAHAVLKQVKMLLTTPASDAHRILLLLSDQSNQPSLPPSTSVEPVVPPS